MIPAFQPGPRLLELISDLLADEGLNLIVVDDGSSAACRSTFETLASRPRVTLLRHATNLGKGQALKTAFNHVLLQRSGDCAGVVTADADGQHLPADIRRLCAALHAQPDALSLGRRELGRDIPWKSAVGNALTRHVFRLVVGARLHDTQSGLRAIPRTLLPELLRIPATGYEFELEMLIAAVRRGVEIVEVPIATIYEEGNRSTHFNPIRDSLRIYFVFLRYAAISLATAGVDFAAFAAAFPVTGNILGSTILARLVAGTFNFYFARTLVFRSRGAAAPELVRYVALVAWLMLVSYGLVTVLVIFVGFGVYTAKLTAETSLFLASFALQRFLVFPPPAAARA